MVFRRYIMDKNKVNTFIKKVFSLVILLTSTVIITQAAYYLALPSEDEVFYGYDGVRHLIIPIVICCLFYYSFIRFRTIYNEDLRNTYLATDKKQGFFAFVFKNPEIWFDLIGFAFVLFAFDTNKTYKFLTEFPLYGENKATVYLIFLAVLFVLNVIARFNATRLWMQNQEGNFSDYFYQGEENKNITHKHVIVPGQFAVMRFVAKKTSGTNPALNQEENGGDADYSKKAKNESFMALYVIVTLSIFIARYVYYILKLLLVLIVPLWKLILAVVIILSVALFVARRINALIKRQAFIKEINRICKEKNYSISEINCGLTDITSVSKGDDFVIEINGEKYSCKFIPCIKSTVPLILRENGLGSFVHAFVFAYVQWWQYNTRFNFGYESEHKKILIISPSSKFIHKVWERSLKELDNGDYVGDYRVYTGGSFLRAVERNCLDK